MTVSGNSYTSDYNFGHDDIESTTDAQYEDESIEGPSVDEAVIRQGMLIKIGFIFLIFGVTVLAGITPQRMKGIT